MCLARSTTRRTNPTGKSTAQSHNPCRRSHIIKKDHPLVGVTEHPLEEGKRVAVMINYSPEPANVTLRLAHGWQIVDTLRGEPLNRAGENWQCSLPANDGSVFILTRA